MKAIWVVAQNKDDALAMLSEGFCPACRTRFTPDPYGELRCAMGWSYELVRDVVQHGGVIVTVEEWEQ